MYARNPSGWFRHERFRRSWLIGLLQLEYGLRNAQKIITCLGVTAYPFTGFFSNWYCTITVNQK